MGMFESFVPVIHRKELTTAELDLIQELGALADSSDGQYIRKVGGAIVNATTAEVLLLADLSDVDLAAPTNNQVLAYSNGKWINASASSGDVAGPASATDNNIAVFDGVTGKLLKDGGATVASKADVGQTMYIGTTAHAINRASAAEGLAGITSLTPGANFTLVNNGVNVLTSENVGGIVNTLYLKAGNVGIGTTAPAAPLDILGTTTTASLGTEMITSATDQNFTGSIGNWTAGTNWAYGTDNAAHTAGTTGTLSLANGFLTAAPVSGNIYQITFTANTTTAGTLTMSFGSVSGIAIGQSTGTLTAETQVITATGTGALTFTPNAAWAGTIDDVSVKLITPSSATQIVRNSDNTIGLEIRSGGTGDQGTFIGYQAGLSNTSSGNFNSFIGYQAGKSNTTGEQNTASGYLSLSSNTTGLYNTASGSNSLRFNTTGFTNTASGSNSLLNNTTGSYNTALGYRSLYSNITGFYNTASGRNSLYYNNTGSQNTALGNSSLTSNTTGSNNTASGSNSLLNNTTGSYNTALGYDAGRYQADGATELTDPENSVYLGYGTRGFSNADSNSIVIGYNAIGIGANTVVLGNDSITTTALKGKVGIGTTAPDKKVEINLGTADALRLTYNDANGSAAVYSDFTLSSGGVLNIAPTGLTATITGRLASTATAVTVAAAATTFAVASNVVMVTGDAGANTIATITGGVSGQVLTLIFVDALVTITDDATAGANTVNLSAAFTSSANDTMQLVFNGTSWREVSRSIN